MNWFTKAFGRKQSVPDHLRFIEMLINKGDRLMNAIALFRSALAKTLAKLEDLSKALETRDVRIADLEAFSKDKDAKIVELQDTIQALNPDRLNATIAELNAKVADYEKVFADAAAMMSGEKPPVVGSTDGIDR